MTELVVQYRISLNRDRSREENAAAAPKRPPLDQSWFNSAQVATKAPLMVVAPEAGTMVVFLSADIPHEVRTAHQLRCSIAGWYRVNEGVEGPLQRY